MTTAYTSLLGLALPVTGELSGTWGDTVNTAITSLLDTAVAGTTSITVDADITLTTTTGASNQARQAIILWNPASGTTTRNITAPAQSKIYTVINASGGTQSIVLRGVGPTTGVTIVKGETALCAWNGSDFIKISNSNGSGAFTNLAVSGTTTLSGLTASTALALDASKNVVSVTNTGTGSNVLATSPTLVTPILGTPTSATLTNATGLPISTGVSGLGTGVATALAVNVGSAGAPVVNGGALGTPSSGTVTNLTGTASININGTVGATTANTGAFTTLSTTGLLTAADLTDQSLTAGRVTYAGTGGNLVDSANLTFNGTTLTAGGLAGPLNGTVGATTANTGAFTTLTTSSTVTLNGGTANGVPYLNGSKVLTTGSALTFDGTNLFNSGLIRSVGLSTVNSLSSLNQFANFTVDSAGLNILSSYVTSGDGSIRFSPVGSEQMRLTSTGLGIGTSSPVINSNGRTVHLHAPAGEWALFHATNGDSGALGGDGSIYGQIGLDAYAFNYEAGALIFGTSAAERMRLDSSGNLGLGVTPSAIFGTTFRVGPVGGLGTLSVPAGYLYSDTTNDLKYAAGTSANGAHIFASAYSAGEYARIDSSGKLLVGTTSSLGTAGIAEFVQSAAGSAGAVISADATNATFSYSIAWFAANRSASSAFNFINCTSDQYASPQFRVQGNGVILAQNTTVQSISDIRTKENIRDAEDGLQVILGLKTRRFDFKQGFGNQQKNVLGFIAQEIEAVFPDAVSEVFIDPDNTGDAFKTVGPGALIPVLVKAIQELKAEFDAYKANL